MAPLGYACRFAALAPAILQQEKCNPPVVCGNLVPIPQTTGFIAHPFLSLKGGTRPRAAAVYVPAL